MSNIECTVDTVQYYRGIPKNQTRCINHKYAIAVTRPLVTYLVCFVLRYDVLLYIVLFQSQDNSRDGDQIQSDLLSQEWVDVS